jgi:hypothetical protein
VTARPRRRRFTAEYKRSILDQADAAQVVGAMTEPELENEAHCGVFQEYSVAEWGVRS